MVSNISTFILTLLDFFAGQICTELFDPELAYEDMSFVEVVQLVEKLMNEPETVCVVDAGKLHRILIFIYLLFFFIAEALNLYEENQSTYNQNITTAVMAQVPR